MAQSQKTRLETYNLLRTVHRMVDDINFEGMSNKDDNATDAVQAVLYMAEERFAREENV